MRLVVLIQEARRLATIPTMTSLIQ